MEKRKSIQWHNWNISETIYLIFNVTNYPFFIFFLHLTDYDGTMELGGTNFIKKIPQKIVALKTQKQIYKKYFILFFSTHSSMQLLYCLLMFLCMYLTDSWWNIKGSWISRQQKLTIFLQFRRVKLIYNVSSVT